MGVTLIGQQATFLENTSYFYIVGISFGCSNNIVDVNQIDFVKSSNRAKFFRGLMGAMILVPIYLILN